jgi:hypothetical protein
MEEHPSIDYLAGGYVGFGAQNLCYAPIEKHVNRAHALQCMPVANPTLFMRCDTVFSMFESYFTINSNTNPLNFFREGYDRAEDYEHICRALDMGLSIYNVNRPLIYYRFGAHNTIEDRQQIASAEKIQVEYGTMWAVDDLVDGGGG